MKKKKGMAGFIFLISAIVLICRYALNADINSDTDKLNQLIKRAKFDFSAVAVGKEIFLLKSPQKIAGVRGDIKENNPFKLYWMGKKSAEVSTLSDISDSSVILAEIEKIDKLLESSDYNTAEDSTVCLLFKYKTQSRMAEILSAKLIFIKVANHKKISALKDVDNYLKTYTAGLYRDKLILLRDTIFSDEK